MDRFNQEKQQKIWEEEHAHPYLLAQIDSTEVSGGVARFFHFLQENKLPHQKGLEMGCGKGRNVIWLASQGVEMYGFDFSVSAIQEAERRALKNSVHGTHFVVQDATKKWDYSSDVFDFGIDCFTSTDIYFSEGRENAIKEFFRVVKPDGYLFVYTLSPNDKYHQEMLKRFPAEERNSFFHPKTGKFEKVFDAEEIDNLYKDFRLVKREKVAKVTQFFDKKYDCEHFWNIFKKI